MTQNLRNIRCVLFDNTELEKIHLSFNEMVRVIRLFRDTLGHTWTHLDTLGHT